MNIDILVHGKTINLSTYLAPYGIGWTHYCLSITIKDRQVRWGRFARNDVKMDFDSIVKNTIARFSRTRGRMDRCARYLLPRSGVSGREMFTVIKESLERRPK